MLTNFILVPVDPPPEFLESSGRWMWMLPKNAQFSGCSNRVVSASREWWEYCPSEAKPHPMSEAVMLRDSRWYWTVPLTDENPFKTELYNEIAHRERVEQEYSQACGEREKLRTDLSNANRILDELREFTQRMQRLGALIVPAEQLAKLQEKVDPVEEENRIHEEIDDFRELVYQRFVVSPGKIRSFYLSVLEFVLDRSRTPKRG